ALGVVDRAGRVDDLDLETGRDLGRGQAHDRIASGTDFVDRHHRTVVAGQDVAAELVGRQESLDTRRGAETDAAGDDDREGRRTGVGGRRLDRDRPGARIDLVVRRFVDAR